MYLHLRVFVYDVDRTKGNYFHIIVSIDFKNKFYIEIFYFIKFLLGKF